MAKKDTSQLAVNIIQLTLKQFFRGPSFCSQSRNHAESNALLFKSRKTSRVIEVAVDQLFIPGITSESLIMTDIDIKDVNIIEASTSQQNVPFSLQDVSISTLASADVSMSSDVQESTSTFDGQNSSLQKRLLILVLYLLLFFHLANCIEHNSNHTQTWDIK